MYKSALNAAQIWLSQASTVCLQKSAPFSVFKKETYIWNVAVGGACLLFVTLSLGGLILRVLDAVRRRKNW